MWVLIAGFLVMFMQAGFAMVETGFTRAKNAAHTMAHELHDLSAGHARLLCLRLRHHVRRPRRDLAPWAATPGSTTRSPSTLFGKTLGLFGAKGFFLTGDSL